LLISTIIIVRLAGKAYLKWVSSNWIDFRGYGESDKSNDSNFYGTTNLANDVINLIDHLKLENIRLIGYSMGTVIRFIKYPSWVFFNRIDSHWWRTHWSSLYIWKSFTGLTDLLSYETFPVTAKSYFCILEFFKQIGLEKNHDCF
jgi:hypothetical protein